VNWHPNVSCDAFKARPMPGNPDASDAQRT